MVSGLKPFSFLLIGYQHQFLEIALHMRFHFAFVQITLIYGFLAGSLIPLLDHIARTSLILNLKGVYFLVPVRLIKDTNVLSLFQVVYLFPGILFWMNINLTESQISALGQEDFISHVLTWKEREPCQLAHGRLTGRQFWIFEEGTWDLDVL